MSFGSPLRHPAEEVLEEYAFGRLGEKESVPVEEHLLVCESCRTKIHQNTEFILAMKHGAKPVPGLIETERPGAARDSWWKPRGRPALTPIRAALAAAVALVLAVAVLNFPRTPERPAELVTLVALRGDPAHAAHAPAGRPLALDIEVPDISATQCRVEVVNTAGRSVWSGTASAEPGRLRITAAPLRAGSYFVRLYTGGTEPIREFGSQVN